MLCLPAVAVGVEAGVGFGMEAMPDCLIKRSTCALLLLVVLTHGVL